MTFELERDPLESGAKSNILVTVELGKYSQNRVALVMRNRHGTIGSDVLLNQREVADLITALQYYASLAREN